jgi:hypothetical protein
MLRELMKKPWLLMTCLVASLALGSCSFEREHPGEEQVKAVLAGRYCSEDLQHRMEIGHDGRYSGRRTQRNAFGTGLLPEKCEGNYKLRYEAEKNAWILVFEPSDKNSNPFIKCSGSEVTVWEEGKGYLVGDSIVTLKDPLDGAVVSSKCDL